MEDNKLEMQNSKSKAPETESIVDGYPGEVLDTNAASTEFVLESMSEPSQSVRWVGKTVYVNKSGQSINVYSATNGGGSIVGHILSNEVFVEYGSEGTGISIRFVNTSGAFASGYLNGAAALPNSLFTPITDYPYRMYNNMYVFMLRRSATVKDPSGTNIYTLSSGNEICCSDSKCGDNYNNYKRFVGYIAGSAYYYYGNAFVDMGFNYGSFGSNMTIYGTY
jgi:hypothetical protein